MAAYFSSQHGVEDGDECPTSIEATSIGHIQSKQSPE